MKLDWSTESMAPWRSHVGMWLEFIALSIMVKLTWFSEYVGRVRFPWNIPEPHIRAPHVVQISNEWMFLTAVIVCAIVGALVLGWPSLKASPVAVKE